MSIITCNHANELPNVCPCEADCYCRVVGACKGKPPAHLRGEGEPCEWCGSRIAVCECPAEPSAPTAEGPRQAAIDEANRILGSYSGKQLRDKLASQAETLATLQRNLDACDARFQAEHQQRKDCQAQIATLQREKEELALLKNIDINTARGGMAKWETIAAGLEAEVATLQREKEALTALAYIGEHHFPDLTYKARLAEAEAEVATLTGERDEERETVEGCQQEIRNIHKHYRGKLTAAEAEAHRSRAALNQAAQFLRLVSYPAAAADCEAALTAPAPKDSDGE